MVVTRVAVVPDYAPPRPGPAPPPPTTDTVLRGVVTVVVGVPSLLPPCFFTDAGFLLVIHSLGGFLLDTEFRSYCLTKEDDGRLSLPCQAVRGTEGNVLLVGAPPGSGVAFSVLIDSGAAIPVWASGESDKLVRLLNCPGQSVVGVGGHAPSVNSGIVEIRMRARPVGSSPTPGVLQRLYGGPAHVAIAGLVPSPARRVSAGPRIRSADELAQRLCLWNPRHLTAYPSLVDGVSAYPAPSVDPPSRLAAFFRAARGRSVVHNARSATSAVVQDRYARGEFFWVDWTQVFERDLDGNIVGMVCFDNATGFPVFFANPGKSSACFGRVLTRLGRLVDHHLPGTRLKRISGDFDPAWAVQGHIENITPADLREFLRGNPQCHIVPNPPHSPELNRAEPWTRRLGGIAFGNAILSSLSMTRAWSDMYRGAASQYALHLVDLPSSDGSTRLMTRLEAFTGRRPDITRELPARPGQLGWVMQPKPNTSNGESRAVSAYFICHDAMVSGHWMRMFHSGRPALVPAARVVIVDDTSVRAALSTSELFQPRGLLGDPTRAAVNAAFHGLLQDYDGPLPSDLGLLVARIDPASGMPLAPLKLVPGINPEGDVILTTEAPVAPPVAKPPDTSLPVPPPTGGTFTLLYPGFRPIPGAPMHALWPSAKAWFKGLPAPTPVRVLTDPTRPAAKPDGRPHPSYARRLPYTSATTVGELGILAGMRWADVSWDAARGLILFELKTLAGLPPDDTAAAAVATAALGIALDPTLAEFARLEALEDLPRLTAPAGLPTSAPNAPPHPGLAAQAARILLANLTDNYDPHMSAADELNPAHYEPPLAAAAFALQGLPQGANAAALPTLPTSARVAASMPDFHGPGGWKEAIASEVARVAGHGGLKVVRRSLFYELSRKYPGKVSQGHIVLAFKNKYFPDGSFDRRKARIAYADKIEKLASAHADYFSGCAEKQTDLLTTQIVVNEGGVQHTVDVGGAFFKGTPPSLEEGGRGAFAAMPKWLSDYGDYPTHAADGEVLLLWICANMPGRKDASRVWEREYDKFLFKIGMHQCVYDLRCFYVAAPPTWTIVHVHVDDTRISASDEAGVWEFVRLWEAEFEEDVDHSTLSEFFCGVQHRYIGDTCELSVGASLDGLASVLLEFPLPAGMTSAYPLSPDAPSRLQAEPGELSPLAPGRLSAAQRLCGIAGWTTIVRHDVLLALRLLSRYVTPERLTEYVFNEILRLCHYLVSTRHMALVLRRVPRGRQLQAWVDSSLANAFGGRSMGGFCIGYEGSGALLCVCGAPATVAESSGVTELHQAVLCTKAVIGMRIFLRELERYPIGPTLTHTDAQVLLDGTHCRRVSKESKWVAPRYAMIRKAEADGAVVFQKIATQDNTADMFTKPLTGVIFAKHRAAVLGHLSPEA